MILMYHKVERMNYTYWWVSSDAFYRQMASLQAYNVVSLADYDPSDPSHVVVTFDGVYENVYRYAYPILKKFKYPFELFVIGDYIGRDNSFDAPEPLCNFANLDQLQQMCADGGTLQWHTRTHQRLNGLQGDALLGELTPPDALKQAFGKPNWNFFAYPHGECSDIAYNIIRSNFNGALSVEAGDDHDIYKLNRVTCHEGSNFSTSKVSIIVANYNYKNYLDEAVSSVLSQTVQPDEFIIIDDCSTDGSHQILEKYKDIASVVINEKNLGIVNNFNKAVSIAQGDYIAFLGADNRMRCDYVELCKAALDKNPKASVAYTDMLVFGPLAATMVRNTPYYNITFFADSSSERTPLYYWSFPDISEDVLQRFYKHNFIHGSSMYRKKAFDVVGGYRTEGGPEDHHLFRRMVKSTDDAIHISEALIEYRQHSLGQQNTVLLLERALVNAQKESTAKDALLKELISLNAQAGKRIASLEKRILLRDKKIEELIAMQHINARK